MENSTELTPKIHQRMPRWARVATVGTALGVIGAGISTAVFYEIEHRLPFSESKLLNPNEFAKVDWDCKVPDRNPCDGFTEGTTTEVTLTQCGHHDDLLSKATITDKEYTANDCKELTVKYDGTPNSAPDWINYGGIVIQEAIKEFNEDYKFQH